jgi:hypothetical protein
MPRWHTVRRFDLRASLQRTLAGTYTMERDLGGGGMSSADEVREEGLTAAWLRP